jgi:hypothetical protein
MQGGNPPPKVGDEVGYWGGTGTLLIIDKSAPPGTPAFMVQVGPKTTSWVKEITFGGHQWSNKRGG